jgi:hypothetical protein
MKKYNMLLIAIAVMLLQGCAFDFMGPCHRATLLRKEAMDVKGLKKAELLGKADALQAECDRNNQMIYNRQKYGR